MENLLKNLEPKKLFSYFEELTKIPRESDNEREVSNYLVGFAKKNNLEVIQEDCLNVIIKKPGTVGYENSKTVILQGHMDMVCVKEDGLEFDFSKEPIPILVDGDYIKTKGTTLGADNGIAVAMIMAILVSDNISHPPITALITVNEESGMTGVMELNPENISGDILINLDSEEEGTALCSCAGGIRNALSIPVNLIKNTEEDFQGVNIFIKGLLGGHSGAEIDKNRANSIKLLGRTLNFLRKEIPFKLVNVSGGDKMNAIAKSAEALILVPMSEKQNFFDKLGEIENIFKNEFSISDPNIVIKFENGSSDKSMDVESQNRVIDSLLMIPFGVQTMSSDIPGLVESSSNVGILSTEKNYVLVESSIRSSIKTLKYEISDRIETIAKLVGGEAKKTSEYPEWQFKEKSEIREIMKSVFEKMYNKEFKIDAIHAGLECGFLKEKIGDIDMISIGPDMSDVHTPYEKLSISSTVRTYEFLVKVLELIK